MSVWAAGQSSARNEEGSVAVRTIYVDGVTNSSGEVEFDLTGFDIEEIIDFKSDVLDTATGLTDMILTKVVSITETAAKVIVYQQNEVTVTLGAVIRPFVAVTTGVNVRLVVLCR